MKRKVAVASTDGKVVNQHFGKASSFQIYEVGEKGFCFLEFREITPCCGTYGHTFDAFENAAQALGDCSGVVISRIGPEAREFLREKGFTVFEWPDMVENVLVRLEREENWE